MPHRYKAPRAVAFLATLPLALAAACGESTGPTSNVAVTVGVSGVVGPNINQAPQDGNRVSCDVGLFATASGIGKARWGAATFKWFAGKDRSVAFDSSVAGVADVRRAWGDSIITVGDRLATNWTIWASIPFSAAVDFHYRVGNGPEQIATARFDCGPPVPANTPPAELTNISAVSRFESLEPGGTLFVEYTASSEVGVWRTAVLVSGPCEVYRDFDERFEKSLTKTAVMEIPADCELGTPVDVTVYATDATLDRRARQISTPYRLTDSTRPTLRGATTSRPSGPYFAGDTIDFAVTPSDNNVVKSIVWEVKPFGIRDSVVSPGRGTDVTVRIPVREGWSGPVELRYFSHDAVGLTSDTVATTPGSVAIYPTVQRPTTSASMTEFNDTIDDEVVDVDRGVVYLMQTARRRIAVLSLSTMQVTSAIPLALGPSDIDLTASGDSLLVAFPELGALGVIDLTRTDRRVELVTLDAISDGFFGPLRVLSASEVIALANGKAFLAVHTDPVARRVVEIDLGTGVQRYRGEAGAGSINGIFAEGPLLSRSRDRSVMLVRSNDCLQRYEVVSNTLPVCVRGSTLAPINSVDATGQRIAIGPDLYDAAWRHLRRIELIPAGTGMGSALTLDGRDLFFPLGNAVVKSNALDGKIVDRQLPPVRPSRMHVTPDGKSLVVVGTSVTTGLAALAVIDLR